MCVVCVSAVTIASLIAPTPTPVVQNSVSDYTITRAACPKSKVNKIENNRICLKDGRFYRWAVKKTVTPAPVPSVSPTPIPTVSPTPKPTVAPTPTPVPTTTTVQYTPPSVVGDSVERCKLIESSQRRGFTWAGFPNLQPPTQKFGTVKWAFIPVDFSDMPGEKDFRSSMNTQMNLLSEWFDNASEGKFKVEWVVSDKWVTLPGVSTDYTLTKGINSTPGGVKFFRTAMATADPTFDFTNVQTVIFILPSNQNIANEGENGFPWEQHVKDYVTNEGRISSFSISGKYQTKNNKSLWNYWVHEFGHSIGLPHVGGNGPERPLYGDWTVMADQDGATRELGGWLRFLSQWMPDENVYCKDSKSMTKVEMDLVPVSNKESGIKLAMFTLSETKALLIESRRVNKFSCTTTKPRNGVLVSLLDLSLGHGQDFLLPISPANRNIMETVMCNGTMSNSSVDILLYQGDKVSFGGLTIEVVKQGSFDKIVVTKQ